MSRAPVLFAVALLALPPGAAGCSVGEGRGSATGSLFLDECTQYKGLGSREAPVAFDLRPTFFVADPVDDLKHINPMNHLSIRMQSGGNQIEEADALYLNVQDVAAIARLVGQPIEVGPATNLRGTLSLERSCPFQSIQLELDGTLTFTAFGNPPSPVPDTYNLAFGDRLAASFAFTIVDRRAIQLGGQGAVPLEPEAGGQLSGDFDFIVRQGRAAQAYP